MGAGAGGLTDARPLLPEARGSAGQAKDGTGGVTGRVRGWQRLCGAGGVQGSSQTGVLTGLRRFPAFLPRSWCISRLAAGQLLQPHRLTRC